MGIGFKTEEVIIMSVNFSNNVVQWNEGGTVLRTLRLDLLKNRDIKWVPVIALGACDVVEVCEEALIN
jgi:hypothetical protein